MQTFNEREVQAMFDLMVGGIGAVAAENAVSALEGWLVDLRKDATVVIGMSTDIAKVEALVVRLRDGYKNWSGDEMPTAS